MKTEDMTAPQARKEIEKIEEEHSTVVARMKEIAPPPQQFERNGRMLYPKYSFGQSERHRAALMSDDPNELLELEAEFENLLARARQLDAKREALTERAEEAEREKRVAGAPKTVADASELLEQTGPKIRDLEGQIQELRDTMKRAANDVVEVRRLVGDGAPGMTPEALHELWRQKYADADGRVRARGDSGGIRVVLLEDVKRFLEPPTEEAEKLADEWERTVGSPRRGTQMAPIDKKDRGRMFLRQLTEKRVEMIAKGDFGD